MSMRYSIVQSMGKFIAWSICLTWALSSMALAQPSFEVASVKKHDPKDQTYSPPTCQKNRFRSHGSGILDHLAWAYDLRTDQLLVVEPSLPPWARLEGYDIDAVASEQLAVPQCKV